MQNSDKGDGKERKHAADVLRRLTEQQRIILKNASDHIMVLARDGSIEYLNHAAEGFDLTAVLGTRAQNYLDAGSARIFEESLEATYATGEDSLIDLVDRNARVYRCRLARIYTDPEFKSVVSFATDVTELKQRDDQIQRTLSVQEVINKILRLLLEPLSLDEILQRALDEILSVPWFALLKKGAILLADEETKILGIRVQTGLSDKLLAFCKDKVPVGSCLCGRAASNRETVFADCLDARHEQRYAGITPHGHYCVPIQSDDQLIGVICLYVQEEHPRDIKEETFLTSIAYALAGTIKRKRGEDALRESEQRYRTLLEQAPGALITIDPETTLPIHFNDQILHILGYSREEFRKLRIADYDTMESPDDTRNHVAQIIGDSQDRFETGWRTRDGKLLDILVDVRTVNLAGRSVLHSFAVDITEQKKAEKAQTRYRKQLRRLANELSLAEERERRRIATEIHDRLGQNLVSARIKLAGARRSTGAQVVATELAEVQELLEETIADSRLLLYELSPPVLYELGFEAAVQWLADHLLLKRNGIAWQFEDDEQPKPLDDEIKVLLFQALRELFNNIVRHAQAESVKIALKRQDEHAVVVVNDDGIGFVEKQDLPADGLGGFGLFNIRERLEHFGGVMAIDSESERGTRITLRVPLRAFRPD